MRKDIRYIALSLLLFASSCQRSDEWAERTTDNAGILGVRVVELPASGELPTRDELSGSSATRASGPVAERIDTFDVNDDWCLEVVTSDLVPTDSTKAGNTPDTRGVPLTAATQISSMNLLVYNTLTTNWATTSNLTQTLAVTGKNGAFTIAPTYTWVEGSPDKHTLFAVAPASNASNGLVFDDATKSITYTVPEDVTQQPDLCLSDYSSNKDIINTLDSEKHLQTFYMSHLLTAVGFEAAGYDLRITEAKISGINSVGTVNITTKAWSGISTPAEFRAGLNDNAWLSAIHIETGTPWTNITNSDGYLMMIPQTLTPDAQLTFSYEGRNGQPSGSFTVSLLDVGAEWTAGKRVMYRLRLKTRPAVITDVSVPSFAGYTSMPVNVAAASDDNLTFTWEASWLRLYRGTEAQVNASGGYSSGFQTGTNNWANLRFFGTTDNPSYTVNRTATVTVTGKKSGTRTFKVTQLSAYWDISVDVSSLTLSQWQSNRSFSYTVLGNQSPSVTVSFYSYGLTGMRTWSWFEQNWLQGSHSNGVKTTGTKVSIPIQWKWNVNPVNRSGQIVITAVTPIGTKTKTIPVTQTGQYYVGFDHESFPGSGTTISESGLIYMLTTERHGVWSSGGGCPGGSSPPSRGEFSGQLQRYYKYWQGNAGYRDTEYWTREKKTVFFGWRVHVDLNNGNASFDDAGIGQQKYYRCVRYSY